MAELKACIAYLNQLLEIDAFQDYGPNGLQVEGQNDIRVVVSGVSACQALFSAAIEEQADLVLVHHGLFWNKQSSCLVGVMYQRVKQLMSASISLAAYHLPLDAHLQLGNNAQLSTVLGGQVIGPLDAQQPSIGLIVELPYPMTVQEVTEKLEHTLERTPDYFPGTTPHIQRIGICSGAAQGHFYRAIELGLDAFLTGEVSEYIPHLAQESGVHYFGAGHHATERLGVQALGAVLAENFDLSHVFIDVPNNV